MVEMENHCRKLEYRCTCTHLLIPYAHGSILWPGTSSRFEVPVSSPQVGYFTTWVDDVDPDSLRISQSEIIQRTKSFVLAMQYLGNSGLSATEETLFYISETGEQHKIVDDCDIEAIIRRARGETYTYGNLKLPAFSCSGSMYSSTVQFPQNMPSVPLILERHILTVLQAEALDSKSEHYADEQLKRWFLIIEELHLTRLDHEYKALKCARNFVSHPTSNSTDTVAFLKRELPSSVYIANGREEACYLRHDLQHKAFVSKYETIARQWAKMLVEKAIASEGGYIRP